MSKAVEAGECIRAWYIYSAEAEDHACAEAQIVLPVIQAVAELGAVIVRFQCADREVPGNCYVQPAARNHGEGVGRARKSRTVRGKASAGMRPAQQDLSEGRKNAQTFC